MTGETNVVRTAPSARTEAIALLNDQLRKTGEGGAIVVTRGVRAIHGFEPIALMAALGQCDTFDDGNDPYGERDFGGVDFMGFELLWKIDYYAHDMVHHSRDPADGAQTCRVLTVMHAGEY